MRSLLAWIDQRTGLLGAVRDWFQRPLPGGPAWRWVWPSTIVFAFVTQLVTGLVLWMYYSPGAQTAWESVYYIQSEVAGGWLLRAIHHYAAQVMLVLVGLYLVQMIVRGSYRAPREFLYWSVLLMGLTVLGLNLTGDLFAWDQNAYWSTQVRTGFLLLLPGIGEDLLKVAVGGSGFGHLTLTRFLALHVGVLTAALAGLLLAHCLLARRHGLQQRHDDAQPGTAYWPRQAARDAIACVAVLAVVLVLSLQHGFGGDEAGVGLGAPANAAEAYAAARPEWSFRGLYELTHLFPPTLQILPVFVLSGLTVGVFLLMPCIAWMKWGHQFNLAFTAAVLLGLVGLSWASLARDRNDAEYQKALADGATEAGRVKVLARSPEGIPVSGAMALLRNDAKTQGPRLFKQHCASCHDYANPDDAEDPANIRAETSSAPNLFAFASRQWIAGLLDPKQIKGPQYFGNTKFRAGDMAGFVKETFGSLDTELKKDRELAVMAVSAEARLKAQSQQDADDAEEIKQGKKLLLDDFGCTSCHRLHDKGQLGDGPDLTGYGSEEWLVGIIGNPAHKRFYGEENDRMPAYAEFPHEPAKNILSARDIRLLAQWLRGEWYEE